jgi:poly-gamma-glutamate synthesis protein (capsule biosynthesis protein)
MISVFTESAFDVVSLAGNHTMEWGEDVVHDTVALFEKKGIRTVGAGRNLDEACAPVVIEKHGVRVAFLAFCSVLREGHEAGPNKGGVAPLRAHTTYEFVEWQAGMPVRAITTPYEEDLARMTECVAAAKAAAHVVVLSLHWGLHFVPRVLADYQPIAAKAAFEAGADLILGHHPHVPKAIEMHRDNKACFYSLGNFMFSTNTALKPGYVDKMRRYGVAADVDEYPNCPHGEDSHRSLIAKAVLSRNGLERTSFLPVQIDKELRPEPLRHGQPRFDENVRFMDWASQGYNHQFAVEGDEVVVTSRFNTEGNQR